MQLYGARTRVICLIFLVEISKVFQSWIETSVLTKSGLFYEVHEYIIEVHFIEEDNFSQYYQIQHLQAASPLVTLYWRY